MSREDIQKLLGGYATGTLTAEEQRALFDAALDDQELFDALAGEQSLRDLLRDPAARAHLLATLDDASVPMRRRAWSQIIRPAAVGVAASLLVVFGVIAVWLARKPAAKPQPAQQLATAAPEVRPSETAATKPPEPKEQPSQRKAPRRIVRAEKSSPPPAPASVAVAEAKQELEGLRAATGPTGAQNSVSVQAEAQVTELSRAGLPQAQPFLPVSTPPVVLQSVSAIQEPPLRVRVLRKREDGTTVEANPADLHAGDTVVLEFRSNLNGFLTVTEFGGGSAASQPLLVNQRIEPAKTVDTPLLPGQAGVRKFMAAFTQQSQAAGTGGFVAGSGQLAPRAAHPREQGPVIITLTYK